jgi:hypothetical protein
LSEYVEFAGAMVLFVGILVGSYWFVVIGPGRNREQRRVEERHEDG